ncbi:MAG: autotransporter domain-containing protein, partial [Fusobacterium ulcerans]
MIEKIMRAVKSTNKKRGRNITIGAIVGMLLSCSAVMGAEVIGLEIGKEHDAIIFKDKDGTSFTPGTENDPYLDNKWNIEKNTYTNNTTISGKTTTNSDKGIGLKLSGDLKEVEFINNGLILGKGKHDCFGIYSNSGSSIGTITNSGIILGTGIESPKYSGIYNENRNNIESIINTGIISGVGNISGFGIFNDNEGIIDSNSCSIVSIINNGLISGISDHEGYGIKNWGSNIEITVNNGLIIGTGKGSGFGIFNTFDNIGSLINIGTIYGSVNAICNYYGTITNAYNYGLLVSKDGLVVENDRGTVDFIKSYGLAFKADGDKYTLDEDYSGEFGEVYSPKEGIVIGYEKDTEGEFDFNKPITEKYTIVNANFKGDLANITGTESLVLKNGILFHDGSDTLGIKDFSSD